MIYNSIGKVLCINNTYTITSLLTAYAVLLSAVSVTCGQLF